MFGQGIHRTHCLEERRNGYTLLYPFLPSEKWPPYRTHDPLCTRSVSDALHLLWNIPVDTVAAREVTVSLDRKEGVESSRVVSEEEESSEDTVAVEGCVNPVDVSGNEVVGAVSVVVVMFGRESSVGLGRTKVGDTDAAGILLHADVPTGLGRSAGLTDGVRSVAGGDLLILLKD